MRTHIYRHHPYAHNHAQTTVKKKNKAGDVEDRPVYKLLVPIKRSKYPGARLSVEVIVRAGVRL